MQFSESVRRDARCAEGHSSTDTGVDHPVWQYHYCASRHLDINKPAVRTLFAVLNPQTSTVKGVPTVVDINFLHDMGRMDA